MTAIGEKMVAVILILITELVVYSAGKALYGRRFGKKLSVTRVGMLFSMLAPFAVWYALISYGEPAVSALEQTVFFIVVICIGIIDKRERIIPNQLIAGMLLIKAVWLMVYWITDREYAGYSIQTAFAGLMVAAVICTLTRLVFRKSIGLGDVKLIMALAVCVGPGKCMYILLAASVMAVVRILAGIIRRSMSRKDFVSFAPFVAWGMLLVLGCGIQ